MRKIIIFLFLLIPTTSFADPENWLFNCEKHRATVENILTQNGVSKKYYYLMVAESHCTENATSSKGAVGFWQMLPATMYKNGCANSNDLECQTYAAANYIKSLEKRFNSFYDVVIAYNMGGHNYCKYGATPQAKGLVHTIKLLINIAKGRKTHGN